MILWFLRLFRAFRDIEGAVMGISQRAVAAESESDGLRSAVQELTNEKFLLQDRLDAALQDKERLWGEMRSAVEHERFALHTQINHSSQKAGAGIPYPTAHSIPAASLPRKQDPGPVGRRARVLPSEVAAMATRNFLDNHFKRNPVEAVTSD